MSAFGIRRWRGHGVSLGVAVALVAAAVGVFAAAGARAAADPIVGTWTRTTGSVRIAVKAASSGFAGTPATAAETSPARTKPKVTGGSSWTATATQFRGQNGSRFTYTCPAGGVANRVWGTSIYTDDSSVCTAAVHAGRITLARGGTVTIVIRPARSSYRGTTRHGIVSGSWRKWHGSFVVVGASAPVSTQPATGGTGWTATAVQFRGQNGSRYTYSCPAGGTAHTVWGTDLYTDDSSVCTAAVHVGRITLAAGGNVTIEIRPGESSYTGSTRNGITTTSYRAWHGSFVVVG